MSGRPVGSRHRVAIVTGGGTGIGAETARVLGANGCAVVLVGRREKRLREVAADLEAAEVVAVDLARRDAPRDIVDTALATFGRLDVLVNNAAMIRNGPFDSFTSDEFDAHVAVNLRAPFFLTQAALPALREGRAPAVINISSSVGSMVKPGTTLYSVTKAGLEYLTRANAYELAQWRIRVNCIAPGPVDTPLHATYMDDVEAGYRDLARRIPLGRMGAVEDVARWVWWLAAPDTEWTTGNVIHVDGGQVLGIPEAAGG
jgi:meso-butanediol dehydrogenase/(S,S)-butanediol dehydrogenase/diacetyl reductase